MAKRPDLKPLVFNKGEPARKAKAASEKPIANADLAFARRVAGEEHPARRPRTRSEIAQAARLKPVNATASTLNVTVSRTSDGLNDYLQIMSADMFAINVVLIAGRITIEDRR